MWQPVKLSCKSRPNPGRLLGVAFEDGTVGTFDIPSKLGGSVCRFIFAEVADERWSYEKVAENLLVFDNEVLGVLAFVFIGPVKIRLKENASVPRDLLAAIKKSLRTRKRRKWLKIGAAALGTVAIGAAAVHTLRHKKQESEPPSESLGKPEKSAAQKQNQPKAPENQGLDVRPVVRNASQSKQPGENPNQTPRVAVRSELPVELQASEPHVVRSKSQTKQADPEREQEKELKATSAFVQLSHLVDSWPLLDKTMHDAPGAIAKVHAEAKLNNGQIKSSLATFLIIIASLHRHTRVPIEQGVKAWLHEKARVAARLSRVRNSDTSPEVFVVEAMRTLRVSEENECRFGYAQMFIATNPIVGLATTGMCQCQCYSFFVVAMAQEFGHEDDVAFFQQSYHIIPAVIDKASRRLVPLIETCLADEYKPKVTPQVDTYCPKMLGLQLSLVVDSSLATDTMAGDWFWGVAHAVTYDLVTRSNKVVGRLAFECQTLSLLAGLPTKTLECFQTHAADRQIGRLLELISEVRRRGSAPCNMYNMARPFNTATSPKSIRQIGEKFARDHLKRRFSNEELEAADQYFEKVQRNAFRHVRSRSMILLATIAAAHGAPVTTAQVLRIWRSYVDRHLQRWGDLATEYSHLATLQPFSLDNSTSLFGAKKYTQLAAVEELFPYAWSPHKPTIVALSDAQELVVARRTSDKDVCGAVIAKIEIKFDEQGDVQIPKEQTCEALSIWENVIWALRELRLVKSKIEVLGILQLAAWLWELPRSLLVALALPDVREAPIDIRFFGETPIPCVTKPKLFALLDNLHLV